MLWSRNKIILREETEVLRNFFGTALKTTLNCLNIKIKILKQKQTCRTF